LRKNDPAENSLFLATTGVAVLVFSGLTMSWIRFSNWRRRSNIPQVEKTPKAELAA
jgi:hypothetical protein